MVFTCAGKRVNMTGHTTTIDNFSIVGREDQSLITTIKEALNIRVNYSSLNKNIGKYHLFHIWDEVLFNTSKLKINPLLGGHSICHHSNNICHFAQHRGYNICLSSLPSATYTTKLVIKSATIPGITSAFIPQW